MVEFDRTPGVVDSAPRGNVLNLLDVFAFETNNPKVKDSEESYCEDKGNRPERKSETVDKTKVDDRVLGLISRTWKVGDRTIEYASADVSRIVRESDGDKLDLHVKRTWLKNNRISGIYLNRSEQKESREPLFLPDQESRLYRKYVDGKATDEVGYLDISSRGVLTFYNRTKGQKETTDYFAPDTVSTLKEALPADIPMPLRKMEFAERAAKIFESIDKDSNGYLTRKELASAMENDKFKGLDAQVVAALYGARASLSSWRGISKADLKSFEKIDAKNPKDISAYSLRTIEEVYRYVDDVAKLQQEKPGESLYRDMAKPADSIKPEAVRQGAARNDFFLSAVAAVAITNPKIIENMIADNKNGTFTVTFPGATKEPITVNKPTEAEMGYYNKPGTHGLWVNVLEKAYGKYCQQKLSRRSVANTSGGHTPSEGGDAIVSMSQGLSLLTGKDVVEKYVAYKQDVARDLLERAFKDKVPVLCQSSDAGGITYDGFRAPHAFTVVAYDPDDGDSGTVTLRCAKGGGEGKTSGTVRISLEKLCRNFSTIACAKK